jgi:hypothetical protein
MKRKTIRFIFYVVGFMFIFILGILIGYTFNETKKQSDAIYSQLILSDTTLDEDIKGIKQKALKTFSFAYNITHLWSMRLANKNYYDLARLLPCRTITYVGGPTNETTNSCDQSTLNEFSIERTLFAQKWIYEHQNPPDCTNKKFAILKNFAWSGIGSTIHQIVWAFGTALAQDRIVVYHTPGNWVRQH